MYFIRYCFLFVHTLVLNFEYSLKFFFSRLPQYLLKETSCDSSPFSLFFPNHFGETSFSILDTPNWLIFYFTNSDHFVPRFRFQSFCSWWQVASRESNSSSASFLPCWISEYFTTQGHTSFSFCPCISRSSCFLYAFSFSFLSLFQI